MNRKLLALAVGAALSVPMVAQAAPTLYGKLDVSVEYLDGDLGAGLPAAVDVSDTTVESNQSRIGVRGQEKLNNALSVVYQAEWGVNVDGDSANSYDLVMRDRFVGLAHNDLGTLRVGFMNTPLKEAEGQVDVFNDSRLDIENVFTGQNRSTNSISYTSPRIADMLTLRVAHITQTGDSWPYPSANFGSAESMSLTMEQGGLYLAVAVDNNVSGYADFGVLNGNLPVPTSFYLAGAAELDTLRVVGGFTMGDLRLGALYQQAEIQGPGVQPEQTGYLLSAAYTAGKWTFKGQYAASEGEAGTVDLGEITQIALGVDYQWTQTFKTYGMLGNFQYDDAAAGTADTDLNLLGVGMSLAF